MSKDGENTLLQFERTSLWRGAFCRKNRESAITDFYAGHLRDLRDKARALIDQLRADMPFLTVHDITHLDGVWEVASAIAGPSYSLTPAEGYVFGAAILLHDAAMCVAAFPGGLADIMKTNEWKDTVVMLMADATGKVRAADNSQQPPKEIVERAVPIVLRLLHAREAEELPRRKWVDGCGEPQYLVENAELRDFYGRLIGRIARSHGEAISWIRKEVGPPLGPAPLHDGGDVNGLKLACLLRAADAAHIDARRAPPFERTVIKPKGIADLHWTFQGKLAKVRIEGDALVYSAGSPFSLADADAWWVCFDAVQAADRELRDVDVALEEAKQRRFNARRVRGAESPRDLSQDIPTEGWDPIDARLRVSNVPHLVQMFGGERLYGRDRKVAIRELIQNAADAIRARRADQRDFTDADGGEIVVRLDEREGGHWLEVEDNGVGMSERTITETLLDFGQSFWATDAVRIEFPGLMAKGMAPTGKFGIGFFSVFMLGETVKVTSRRYDSAAKDARTLEFRHGLAMRPILRRPTPDEAMPSGGTRVSVRLTPPPYDEGGVLSKEEFLGRPSREDLGTVVAALCPSLDVSVSVVHGGRKRRVIKKDDWRRVDGSRLLMRLEASRRREDVSYYGNNLRPIILGGTVYGRACIRPDAYWHIAGRITVGGFVAGNLAFLEGVLLGETEVLTRNRASLTAPPEALARWAEEQADLLASSRIPPAEQLVAAGVVIACGGDPRRLPIAHMGGRYLNKRHLKAVVRAMASITVFEGEPSFDEDSDDCHPREFRNSFEPSPSVLFLGEVPRTSYEKSWWPGVPSYRAILKLLLERGWRKCELKTVEGKTVGRVNGAEIVREAEVFTRIA